MMKKPSEIASGDAVETNDEVNKQKMNEATELVDRIRKLRIQAEDNELKMIAYFLKMAEIEASDYVAGVSHEVKQ